ncbi:methyltransferase [Luteolibacter yonseiensis]|uniref:Methyltransferase n=1 Tax=Luteolibacter yonseiensis TaxID=1144680 RepID=A0A934R3X8_9BACT|nr:methyltransferase [Luteolibacter yonseiensis]MBK1815836.1 methyltransferase [Luteolibacter yonseiensis]
MFSEKALASWDPAPFLATLKRAGYTARTAEEIGIKSLPDPFARTAVVSRTFPGSPLSIAYRLFDAGEPVTGREALLLFGEQLHGLVTLGLIEPLGNDLVRSVAHLEADEGGWFASDHAAALLSNRTDYTMGIGLSTRMLAALAPGRAGCPALDLCTGAGWGAIRLAASGCRVTAADINPRALGFARMNVRLAGGGSVEFLEGDLFAPVEGRRFDVITANPPFVISPETTFTFRDSGLGGDSFCEHLARRMPDHLNPGGIGVMLLNWYDNGDDASSTRPLEWLEGSGCGTWLLRSLTQNPADYATRWLRDSGRGRTPSAETLDRWVSYLTEIGARRIHYGFLVIHRGQGPPWTRAESRGIEKIEPTAGAEVRRVVEGEAWLALHQPDDARLLDGLYTVVDGIRAETDMILDKGWGARTIRLISPGQLSYDGQIDEFLLRLLALCREGRAPASMVAELRAHPHFANNPELAPQIAGLVRELIRHGLLAPA